MVKDKIKSWVVLANFIAIGVVFILLVNFISIPLIHPGDGLVTDNRKPKFSWLGFHGVYNITIDDNPEFRTPVTKRVLGNYYVPERDLDFKTYYWKVESNGIESNSGNFRVVSTVALEREREIVKNVGNVRVLLDKITGLVTLKVGESVKVGEEENVKAEQV